MTSKTRWRVSELTSPLLLSTRETVISETPASRLRRTWWRAWALWSSLTFVNAIGNAHVNANSMIAHLRPFVKRPLLTFGPLRDIMGNRRWWLDGPVHPKEGNMAESVYKIVELVGTSTESWKRPLPPLWPRQPKACATCA